MQKILQGAKHGAEALWRCEAASHHITAVPTGQQKDPFRSPGQGTQGLSWGLLGMGSRMMKRWHLALSMAALPRWRK